MRKEHYELIVIGGGPAGLSAALGARAAGLRHILVVERMPQLGGMLFQCIHMGFGVRQYGAEMTGPEYAGRLISMAREAQIEFLTDAAVLSVGDDRVLTIASSDEGALRCRAETVILATGCRERPIGSLPVAGTRPSGIFTAGAAQRLINVKGYDIGDRVLILGSGDIGLIMARRLTLDGKRVLGVIEQFPHCTGLLRNKVQCLDEFGIPLLAGHTVAEVFGAERITGAAVCPVDEALRPLPHGRQYIPCDTLITSVGLIPETELLSSLDVLRSGGELCVNEQWGTSLPWLFVCGNALFVHDLADAVSAEAEQAGKNAAEYVMYRNTGVFQPSAAQAAPPPKKLAPDEIVCTVCPNGCILTVNKDAVTGGLCRKGILYARQELSGPKRYVTATVLADHPHRRIPVRSSAPVPKELVAKIVAEIKKITVLPPVEAGEVILRNAAGSGADIIATSDVMNECPPD